MTRRVSSLDKTTIGIDRDINSQYDNVKTVADNILDVEIVADNIGVVLTAEQNAQDALASQTAAAISETNAAASEAAAAISETNAATSETNAATSETNAAATLTAFQNIYYGPLASAPVTNINVGDLYFDTTDSIMKVCQSIGPDVWINSGSTVNGISQSTRFVATAGQTTFSMVYDPGFLNVFINGLWVDSADYTAVDGANVVLTTPAELDDIVYIIAFSIFAVADTYTIAQTDTAISNAVTSHETLHPALIPDFITFDTTPETTSTAQGSVAWNQDELTLDLIQNGTILQLGQELQYNVRNGTGAVIADGIPVMATGTLGASGRITIAPMDGTDPANTHLYLGVSTESIASGADGKVTSFGKVRGIDTSSFVDGQILWLSTTVIGEFTSTEPVYPAAAIATAFVINAKNNGTIFVRATNLDLNAFEPADATILKDADIGVSVASQNHVTTHPAPTARDTRNQIADINTVIDASYVHTDNNYTTPEKTELGYLTELNTTNGFDRQNLDLAGTLSYSDVNRTLTIDVKAGQSVFEYWVDGVKFSSASAITSAAIPDTTSIYFFYLDDLGGLISLPVASFTDDVIFKYCFVGAVYWNATTGAGLWFDERHGHRMDSATHSYWHNTVGSMYSSGFGISGLVDGTGVYTQIDSGAFYDEDIKHVSGAELTQPFLYRSGATGEWAWTVADNHVAYDTGGGVHVWNEWNGTTWTLTPTIPLKDHFLTFYVKINTINGLQPSGFKIIGQNAYKNRADARAAIDSEITALNLEGLPSAELIFIGATIANSNGDLRTMADDSLFYDLRGTRITGSGGVSGSATVAGDVTTTVTNFDGHLSATDTDVQTALETLDDHVHDTRYELADATILKNADIGVSVQAYDADTLKSDTAATLTAGYKCTPVALTDGATVALNLALSQVFTLSMGGNRTLSNPTNGGAGVWYVYVTPSGAFTLALDTAFTVMDGVFDPTSGVKNRLAITSDDGVTYLVNIEQVP